jgi:hypothetical protein
MSFFVESFLFLNILATTTTTTTTTFTTTTFTTSTCIIDFSSNLSFSILIFLASFLTASTPSSFSSPIDGSDLFLVLV